MDYYGAKELAEAFRTVRNNTIKIANDIPEEKYDFKASADTRSIRETLVHIALSTTFPMQLHQNKLDNLQKLNFQQLRATLEIEQAKPRGKAEIVELLQTAGDGFAGYLEALDEAFLAERVTMMPGAQPPTKTRFEMLLGTKEHEMHHRGQLMLIERMLGIVPHLTREFQERLARLQAAQAQPQR